MTSSAIDKMFEIYTSYKNRTEICIFSKIGSKFIVTFCSKISNILSTADEVTISEYRNVLNRRAVRTLYFNKTHIFREGAAFDLADGAGAYA